jgi:hypothetical protein
VPLSKIQSDILRVLAAHRNPESYVAGAVPINRDTSRFSDDIDVFHDREEDVAAAADADAAVLVQADFSLRWLRRERGIYGAVIERNSESMRLEWARDRDFRFFPTVRDDILATCCMSSISQQITHWRLRGDASRVMCLIFSPSTTDTCRLGPSSGRPLPKTPAFHRKA